MMSKPAASLMIALFDRVVCIKISGRANFTCSVDLKRVVNELSQRGFSRFLLDLSECIIMDSTFLGVLAGIGLQFAPNGEPSREPVELLNPNPRISELLENLGVAHLFKIIHEEMPLAEHFEPVSSETDKTSRADVTRTCLEAHKTLMAINPNNVQKFKDVAQFLAEDLRRMEAGEGQGRK